MSRDPVLEARGVVAGYGAIQVVHGVDLDVQPGECLVVLGPNGAGKTTLVEGLTGHLRCTAGTVRYDGQECTDWSPNRRARRGLGYVAQERRLWPGLTVEENLLGGAYGGWSQRTQRLESVREQFGAVDRLRRGQQAGSLSGGEQQILAIGRALMGAPQLLVLDEPSTGLAPAIMESVAALVVTLKARGVSVILIEQMVGLALGVADRALVFVGGRVVLEGTADEIRGNDELLDVYLRG